MQQNRPTPSAPPMLDNEAYPGSQYYAAEKTEAEAYTGAYPHLDLFSCGVMDSSPSASSSTSSSCIAAVESDDGDDGDLFESTSSVSPPLPLDAEPPRYEECDDDNAGAATSVRAVPKSFTNDTDYIKRRGDRVRVQRGVRGTAYHPFEDDDDDDDTKQASTADDGYYYRIEPTLGQRLQSGVSTLATQVHRKIFAAPSSRDAVAMPPNEPPPDGRLDLVSDLGCATLRDALKAKKNLRELRRCSLDPAQFDREGISVSEMQHYGLTLMDVYETLGVQWGRLVNLGLRADKMSRGNKWFDPYVLANCVAREQADLVHDVGFSIDDIYRLKCSSLEITQMGFDFDALLRMGMTKRQFLGLPWYLESMANVLMLEKSHLVDELRLTPDDYRFLVEQRKWSASEMRRLLYFTDDELRELGVVTPSARAVAPSRQPRFAVGPPGIVAVIPAARRPAPSTTTFRSTLDSDEEAASSSEELPNNYADADIAASSRARRTKRDKSEIRFV